MAVSDHRAWTKIETRHGLERDESGEVVINAHGIVLGRALSKTAETILGAILGHGEDRRSNGALVVGSVTMRELWANRFVAVRTWFIGTVIGATPGLGSASAGLVSYSITRQ